MKSDKLPRVICSSVVRAANKGESHGGLYLVDLETGAADQVMDWNTSEIDWQGRGGERGLRGIDFHAGRTIVGAHDEIFFLDRDFRVTGSVRNRYLDDCHEIFVRNGRMYATSTRYNSVLVYDLEAGRFVGGYYLKRNFFNNLFKKFDGRSWPKCAGLPGFLTGCSVSAFDPELDNGPERRDTLHVNTAVREKGALFVSGTNTNFMYEIRDGRIITRARVRLGCHNARPWRGGVIFCDTWNNALVGIDRSGREILRCPVVTYPESELETSHAGSEYARQGWMRGLCFQGDEYAIAGSSPATVSVYELATGELVKSVRLSADVRNAVHGLEVYPY